MSKLKKSIIQYFIALGINEILIFGLYVTTAMRAKDFWPATDVIIIGSLNEGFFTMMCTVITFTMVWLLAKFFNDIENREEERGKK